MNSIGGVSFAVLASSASRSWSPKAAGKESVMSQDWRNNEPRIKMREEAMPTPQPAQTQKARGAGEFIGFFVLVFICLAVIAYTCIMPMFPDAGTALASINHPVASESQQPRFTMEELEEQYGNWYVDSWNDDLNAVKVSTRGWLDSGKEWGHKEATVCIVPEDYRALKAVALTKDWFWVKYICRGVRDEQAEK